MVTKIAGLSTMPMPTLIDLWFLVVSLAVPLSRLGAAWSSIASARRVEGETAKRSWRFLGTGLGLWALASAISLARAGLAGEPQGSPSVAEWLRLAAAIALAAAVASYPIQPPDRFGRLRSTLDISILILAVLAMAWLVLLRPVLEVGLSGPAPLFWGAVRLASDLILVVLLVRLVLLARRRSEVAAFQALTLGGLLQTGADLLFAYRQVFPAPLETEFGIPLAEIAASFLIVYAASRIGRRGEEASGMLEEARPIGPPLEALLPVAMTYLVVGFTGVDYWLRGEVDVAGLMISLALCLLLVARQGVIAGQVEMRQFAALVNSSTDLAFIAGPEGGIILSNPALRAALGVGEASPPSPLRMADFIVEDLSGRGDLALAALSGWFGEVHFRPAGGAEFPVSLSLQPVRDERRPVPLLAGTAFNLTDVKAREENLQRAIEEIARARGELALLNVGLETKVEERTSQLARTVADLERVNQELQELDRLKTEFLALISHELRSPLTNIHSGLELLLSQEEGIEGQERESLVLVQEETQRLAHFVDATLDLSSLQAGKFQLAMGPISLGQVAEVARRRFPAQAGGGRVRVSMPADLPAVRADERALGSVFYHLLDNSLKYSESGDVVVAAEAEDGIIRVSVEDPGPGIPEAERERVFDMFHRLDSSDARRVYGHGLGLPLARRLLEAMGGGIRVEARAGGGTRMRFWLPRADAG
jgi:signal transduction histidine kinase